VAADRHVFPLNFYLYPAVSSERRSLAGGVGFPDLSIEPGRPDVCGCGCIPAAL